MISRFGADGLTGLAVIGHICEIAVFVGIALEQMRRDEITAVGNRRKRTDILQHRNLHILAKGSGSKVDERQRFVIDAVALTEHVAAGGLRIAERIKIPQKGFGTQRLSDRNKRRVAGFDERFGKVDMPVRREWQ